MKPKRATVVDIAKNIHVCFITTNVACRAGTMIIVAIFGWKHYIRPRCVSIVAQKTHCKCLGKDCMVGVGKKIGSSQKAPLNFQNLPPVVRKIGILQV